MLFPLSVATCLLNQYFRKVYRRQYEVHKSGIVVVTGASTGIGNHAAIALAQDGYQVYAGVRTEDEMLAIQALGVPTLKPLFLDVTKHGSCHSAVQFLEDAMQEMDLPLVALVNNAGIMTTSPVEFHAMSDARRVFNTNFFGVLDLVQLALPALRKSNGRVVNVSSMVSIAAPPLQGIYAASKAAVEALTDSLRRELLPSGVAVSLIEPAYVATELLRSASASSPSAVSIVRVFRREHPTFDKSTPLGRFRWAVHRVILQNAVKNTTRRLDMMKQAANYRPSPSGQATDEHLSHKQLHRREHHRRRVMRQKDRDVAEAKRMYSHLYSARVEREIAWNVSLAETPACTTWAIRHAISSPTPRTRYPVSNAAGLPSWLLAYAFAFLPDRFVDSQLWPIHT
mmetsp:Transcript_6524/g.10660  ORF Transcript_6524/g.10660 Transcript_6524/m.10660 type:complete len:398 (+) Transcript_6524:176-1369(+)